ncbi:hypothetical protein Sjap_026153 [Stephania japonica]|uniref:Protein FAR1-RELATED SEQUENCE n=1 Tax=Stephania japonica TaxID=461633 RepID=A0AAP0E7G1_9MAGN
MGRPVHWVGLGGSGWAQAGPGLRRNLNRKAKREPTPPVPEPCIVLLASAAKKGAQKVSMAQSDLSLQQIDEQNREDDGEGDDKDDEEVEILDKQLDMMLIPQKYIMDRWRKDFKCIYTRDKRIEEMDCSDSFELDRYDAILSRCATMADFGSTSVHKMMFAFESIKRLQD